MAGCRFSIRWLAVVAAVVTLSGGALVAVPAAALDDGVPFDATAVVSPHVVLRGQSGVEVAVTVTNQEGDSIGSVQVRRPNGAFLEPAACGAAPAGWTGTAVASGSAIVDGCRFESSAGTADNIAAGSSATFHLTFNIQAGNRDMIADSWQVLAHTDDTFDLGSAQSAIAVVGGDLDTEVRTFEISRVVVVDGAGPNPNDPCPEPNQTAPVGATRTILVCGFNRGSSARTPSSAVSTLSGTMLASTGTFSSGSITTGATNRVLTKYTGATITGTAGNGKTIVAGVGLNVTSPAGTASSVVTTLGGFSAYGPVTHFDVSTEADAIAGVPISVTVAAKDAADVVNADYVGTVHFTSSDGAATLPDDYTFTAGDAGTHSFGGVTLTTAGSRSVDVTDGTHVGTANVTVHPAPPSELVLETAADGSGAPVAAQDLAAGSFVTLYAVSRDPYGNFVGNESAEWSLVGVVPGVTDTDLVVAPDGKSAVFTGHLVGAATIHATSSGLPNGDSGVLTVVNGPAASVVLSGSTADLEVGAARAFTATLYDSSGNVVTTGPDATASVTFAKTGGSGSVSGTGSVPAVAGVATTTVTATASGSITLQASAPVAGTASTADSNTLTFSVPSQLEFTGFLGIGAPPSVTKVRAGTPVPLLFGLGGFQGMDIFADGYPRSVQVPCTFPATTAPGEPTDALGRRDLYFVPFVNVYLYPWTTDRDWKNTCRQLVVKFTDGSTYRANFKFTK